ncbi:MAG: hypothetical protein ABJA86_08250 [Nocardioidaceae bacterium]
MGKVVVDLTDLPLGRGGERLFTWMTAGPESNRVENRLTPPDASKVVVDEWMTDCGAIISGRRTFDIANGWKDGHPIDVPIFVVTHRAPTHGEWSPRVSFVTDGIERALELAQEAAGDLKVSVSAADTAQQLSRRASPICATALCAIDESPGLTGARCPDLEDGQHPRPF